MTFSSTASFGGTNRRERNLPSWKHELPQLPPELDGVFPYSGEKQVVCANCIEDDTVRSIICRTNEELRCDFCDQSDPPFGDVQELFEYVYRSLLLEYGDPLHHAIFWDKEEGSWIGIEELDTHDVLNEADSPLGDGSTLAEAFADSIYHDWYRTGSEVGTIEERAIWSWDSFEQRLLNGPRLLFSLSESDLHSPAELSARDLFRFLAKLGEQLQRDFVKKVNTGLCLFRARASSDEYLSSPDELGSPPASRTLSQRLSQAGVTCFYASEDMETAIAEIKAEDTKHISIGHWENTEPLIYADFASHFELPSLFDHAVSGKRRYILFVREFVDRITRPVNEILGEANSYLATQLLGEFLRYYLPTEWKQGVDAVRFPSNIRPGGVNWVLFGQPDRENEQRIKLIEVAQRSGGN